MESDFNISIVVYIGLVVLLVGGLSVLIGYIMFKRNEINVDEKIQNSYEKVNKEFTQADQNVLDSSNTRINNFNNSLSNVSKSVQNIRSNGTDTVVSGDLCINNLCMSSSTNKTTRVNLDDISGFTNSRIINYQDLRDLETKIDSIQNRIQRIEQEN